MIPITQSVSIGNTAQLFLSDQTNQPTSYFIVGSLANTPSITLFNRKLGIFPDALTVASLAFANQSNFQKFHGVVSQGAVNASLMVPNAQFLRGLTMYYVALTWHPRRPFRLHVSPVVNIVVR
jgi:hypothetical protein